MFFKKINPLFLIKKKITSMRKYRDIMAKETQTIPLGMLTKKKDKDNEPGSLVG